MELAFKSAVEIILQWESNLPREAREEHLSGEKRQKIDKYWQGVYEIQPSIWSSTSEDQSRANNFIGIAMTRLTDEFHNILISTKSSIETHWHLPSTSSLYSSSISTVYELQEDHQLNEESIHDLKAIAKVMSSTGYFHLCIQVYVDVWKSFMDTSFQRLGIEQISIADIKKLFWDELVLKIRRWMQAANCLRIFFLREKRLREHIFTDCIAADKTCFMEIFKDHAIRLFNFAQVASSVSRQPEKLFCMLDLYTTLSHLLPHIYAIFNSESSESIRIQAADTLFQVAEAARGMLSKFENNVLHELSKVPVPQGTKHHLTRYVMNYMILMASTYRTILIELIVSKPSTGSNYSGDMMNCDMESVELDRHTPLALHFIWITLVLQSNLEAKSKGYEDVSLAHLFIMNNVHHIVQKIKGCTELREMIGEYFLEKLIEKFRHEATNYLTLTWDRVLYPLDCKALQAGWSLYLGQKTLKDRLKRFYAMFESAHETQAKWLVLDLQLREEPHLSILNKLVPTYRSFMDRLHEMYKKRSEKYIKYSVEDLENAVLDFFEGHPVSKKLSTSQLKWWKCGIIP